MPNLRLSKNSTIQRTLEFKYQFQVFSELNFNFRFHNPADYILKFINSTFHQSDYELAMTIISDSFMTLCCLIYRPEIIAEGSVIMAACMNNHHESVISETSQSLSFIQDMRNIYTANCF
jgi:hypothetical protein